MPKKNQQRPKLGPRLTAATTEAELTELREVCRQLGIEPPEVLRNLVRAFLAHMREHGKVSLPLKIRFEE